MTNRFEPLTEQCHTDVDEVFDCLSNEYRRLVLETLRSEDVTTEESIGSPDAMPQKQATLELRHRHLPKLRRAGFIDWNEQTGVVSKGPSFDEIERYLRVLSRNSEMLPHDWS